jgi:sec-independent protein translocase protein TatB
MFDVGFSELILIAIVGLLVIGPERLPETIRVTTRWMRNIRRSFEQAKRDVEQELGVDEIKRELHNEEILKALKDAETDLHQTQETLTNLSDDIHHSTTTEINSLDPVAALSTPQQPTPLTPQQPSMPLSSITKSS